ncbi:hypothetical protein ACFOY5_04650 [Massilia aurea]|jgi:hypothetical protein|uniref:hypothetical protein n=1 Tax=Massilia aurea TaxID=373040 RepID=UPI002162068B|nr:hypothetical protein [Massilia aurea]MCS0707487.1 hypothetical protein [Massilia aurea]
MKSSYLRASAALACAVLLTACGGDDGQLLLGGQIAGVTKPGMVLTNNGGSDYEIPVPSNGTGVTTFFFPTRISSDDKYDVRVKSTPTNIEKCELFQNTGRAGFDVTTIQIACTFKTQALTGTVSNLKNDLVLVNGSDRVPVPAGATTFSMARVAQDAPYGVSILANPAGQSCTIANGVGTMGAADVNNVTITCAP